MLHFFTIAVININVPISIPKRFYLQLKWLKYRLNISPVARIASRSRDNRHDVTTRGKFRRAANSAAQIALFTARLHHAGVEWNVKRSRRLPDARIMARRPRDWTPPPPAVPLYARHSQPRPDVSFHRLLLFVAARREKEPAGASSANLQRHRRWHAEPQTYLRCGESQQEVRGQVTCDTRPGQQAQLQALRIVPNCERKD